MEMISLKDDGASFVVTLLEAGSPSCTVLFAVGAGGNPERHLPLLTLLNAQGCTVVAPHFERLAAPRPTEEELQIRARRLRLALEFAARPSLLILGMGHSIGATILIALAGGQMWMGPGRQVPIMTIDGLNKLVLLAPATGFFQAPGALDAIRTPILAWVGARDDVTPPAQTQLLTQSLGSRVSIKVHLVEGAGHFSFMNTLPPQISDPHPNREVLLADIAGEIGRFIAN